MSTVMGTFVQATYALVTCVQISNISTVTGPILTKLFGPNFFGQNFFKKQKGAAVFELASAFWLSFLGAKAPPGLAFCQKKRSVTKKFPNSIILINSTHRWGYCQILDIWYSTSDICYLILDIWDMIFETWYSILNIWYLILDFLF